MYLVVSARLCVCQFPCLSELSCSNPQVWSKGWSLPGRGICLCVCNQGALADKIADMVDRHLIFKMIYLRTTISGVKFTCTLDLL